MQSGLERTLRLVEADGRRALSPAEHASMLSLWSREFSSVHADTLEQAVLTFLREKPRGRPSIGEIHAILERKNPKEKPSNTDERTEITWACGILDHWSRYKSYPSTIQYAERVIHSHGFSHWHDAMTYLIPTWRPPVEEAEL